MCKLQGDRGEWFGSYPPRKRGQLRHAEPAGIGETGEQQAEVHHGHDDHEAAPPFGQGLPTPILYLSLGCHLTGLAGAQEGHEDRGE